MNSFRSNLFWTVVAFMAAAYGIRWAVEHVLPVVQYLAAGLGLGALGWLFVSWRRRRGTY